MHPRCGTSFLFIVMAISILVFVLFGADTSNVVIRVGSRIALLPLVAGLSYELLQYLGRAGDGPIVSALKWPGLMMQKLTTAEPDDSMVEVALAALKASLKMKDPLGEQGEVAGEALQAGQAEAAQELSLIHILPLDEGEVKAFLDQSNVYADFIAHFGEPNAVYIYSIYELPAEAGKMRYLRIGVENQTGEIYGASVVDDLNWLYALWESDE